AEVGIRVDLVTGVQTCALPILAWITGNRSVDDIAGGRDVALIGEVGSGVLINVTVPMDPARDGHVRPRLNFQVHIVKNGKLKEQIGRASCREIEGLINRRGWVV